MDTCPTSLVTVGRRPHGRSRSERSAPRTRRSPRSVESARFLRGRNGRERAPRGGIVVAPGMNGCSAGGVEEGVGGERGRAELRARARPHLLAASRRPRRLRLVL